MEWKAFVWKIEESQHKNIKYKKKILMEEKATKVYALKIHKESEEIHEKKHRNIVYPKTIIKCGNQKAVAMIMLPCWCSCVHSLCDIICLLLISTAFALAESAYIHSTVEAYKITDNESCCCALQCCVYQFV